MSSSVRFHFEVLDFKCHVMHTIALPSEGELQIGRTWKDGKYTSRHQCTLTLPTTGLDFITVTRDGDGDSSICRVGAQPFRLEHGVSYQLAEDGDMLELDRNVDRKKLRLRLGPCPSVTNSAEFMKPELEEAACNGDANLLQRADVGSLAAVDVYYKSSLAHFAAQEGHEECLLILRKRGAAHTLSKADCEGHTPAHLAAKHGHAGCLRLLHELGAAASLLACDSEGKTHRQL